MCVVCVSNNGIDFTILHLPRADTECKLRTSSLKEKCSTIRQKQNTYYCPCEVKGLGSSFIKWKVSSCDCEYNRQTQERQDNSPAPGLIDDSAHFAACLPSLCLCLLFQFQFEYFAIPTARKLVSGPRSEEEDGFDDREAENTSVMRTVLGCLPPLIHQVRDIVILQLSPSSAPSPTKSLW